MNSASDTKLGFGAGEWERLPPLTQAVTTRWPRSALEAFGEDPEGRSVCPVWWLGPRYYRTWLEWGSRSLVWADRFPTVIAGFVTETATNADADRPRTGGLLDVALGEVIPERRDRADDRLHLWHHRKWWLPDVDKGPLNDIPFAGLLAGDFPRLDLKLPAVFGNRYVALRYSDLSQPVLAWPLVEVCDPDQTVCPGLDILEDGIPLTLLLREPTEFERAVARLSRSAPHQLVADEVDRHDTVVRRRDIWWRAPLIQKGPLNNIPKVSSSTLDPSRLNFEEVPLLGLSLVVLGQRSLLLEPVHTRPRIEVKVHQEYSTVGVRRQLVVLLFTPLSHPLTVLQLVKQEGTVGDLERTTPDGFADEQVNRHGTGLDLDLHLFLVDLQVIEARHFEPHLTGGLESEGEALVALRFTSGLVRDSVDTLTTDDRVGSWSRIARAVSVEIELQHFPGRNKLKLVVPSINQSQDLPPLLAS